jgi:hypothetical protein
MRSRNGFNFLRSGGIALLEKVLPAVVCEGLGSGSIPRWIGSGSAEYGGRWRGYNYLRLHEIGP